MSDHRPLIPCTLGSRRTWLQKQPSQSAPQRLTFKVGELNLRLTVEHRTKIKFCTRPKDFIELSKTDNESYLYVIIISITIILLSSNIQKQRIKNNVRNIFDNTKYSNISEHIPLHKVLKTFLMQNVSNQKTETWYVYEQCCIHKDIRRPITKPSARTLGFQSSPLTNIMHRIPDARQQQPKKHKMVTKRHVICLCAILHI